MESWKPVRGYENIYEVSDLGNVRNINGRIKTQTSDKDGYLKVSLNKNGLNKKYFVHRLVVESFIGLCDGREINHKDFNRKNNNVYNLDIVSHAENIKYTKDAGRHISDKDMSGQNNPNYGNHKLGDKYKADVELAKMKQSRAGSTNGRAIQVRMMDDFGNEFNFQYIRECASWLKSHLELNNTLDWIATNISRSAKSGKKYLGMAFEI